MAVSQARKDARNKWDAENMVVVGCKVKRSDAERFREAAKRNGTTPNAVFKACMEAYLEEHGSSENLEESKN